MAFASEGRLIGIAYYKCLLFSFASALRIPYSLNDVIPNASLTWAAAGAAGGIRLLSIHLHIQIV